MGQSQSVMARNNLFNIISGQFLITIWLRADGGHGAAEGQFHWNSALRKLSKRFGHFCLPSLSDCPHHLSSIYITCIFPNLSLLCACWSYSPVNLQSCGLWGKTRPRNTSSFGSTSIHCVFLCLHRSVSRNTRIDWKLVGDVSCKVSASVLLIW